MNKTVRGLAIVLIASLSVFVWLQFAPPALGGKTSIFTTRGTSMQPRLHGGDLVIVREAPQYRIGDVVAYDSKDLKTVVLHRIVGMDSGQFITQGDNNPAVDNDRPTSAAIKGKLVKSYPGLGEKLHSLQSGPLKIAFSVVVGTAAFTLLYRKRRADSVAAAATSAAAAAGSSASSDKIFTALRKSTSNPVLAPRNAVPAGLVVIALAAAISTGVSARSAQTGGDYLYEQQGKFTYTGATYGSGAEVVYPDGVISGGPVYLTLVRDVEFAFDYNFDALARYDGKGEIGMSAVLTDKLGWAHPIDLASTTTFDGPSAQTRGTIDLLALRDLTKNVQKFTNIPQGTYTLELKPVVKIDGKLAGQAVSDTFEPTFDMQFSSSVLQLDKSGTSANAGMNPVKGGLIHANGVSASVTSNPTMNAIVILSLSGALASFLFFRRRRESSDATPLTFVDCDDLSQLAAFALQSESGIEQYSTDGVTSYVAQNGDIAYRYSETVS